MCSDVVYLLVNALINYKCVHIGLKRELQMAMGEFLRERGVEKSIGSF